MRALAAVVLIAFFISLTIFSIGTWSCDQAPKPDSQTQQAKQADKKTCVTFYGTFVAGLQDTGKFIHDFHQETVAIATVVIAIFTIILGIFTISLAHSTDKAASVAEQALKKLERAFIYNSKIEWKGFLREGAPWGDDVGWIFTVEWHNNGATQARRFLNHFNWEVFLNDFDSDLPPDFSFRDMGRAAAGATYIAPKHRTLSEHLPITADILAAVSVNQLRLFVWGWATYEDIFGAPHETQFCFELDRIDGDPYDIPRAQDAKPEIFFNFRVCGRHNCADEDCNQEA
jgi:hypothetical protein